LLPAVLFHVVTVLHCLIGVLSNSMLHVPVNNLFTHSHAHTQITILVAVLALPRLADYAQNVPTKVLEIVGAGYFTDQMLLLVPG